MQPTLPKPESQLPNIPVKIVRQGDKIKLTAGDYSLVLKEMPNKSQTYPLLLLDKFITEVTTALLKKEIDKQNNRLAVKNSLLHLGIDEASATDNVIQRIHNDLFGGQQ